MVWSMALNLRLCGVNHKIGKVEIEYHGEKYVSKEYYFLCTVKKAF